jgi:hypothetical protein
VDPPSTARRLAEVEAAIPQDLYEFMAVLPGVDLLKRIDAALQGSPVEMLRQRVKLRWRDMKSLGLLVELARDVGTLWTKKERERLAGQPPPSAPVDDTITTPMEDEQARWQRLVEHPEQCGTCEGSGWIWFGEGKEKKKHPCGNCPKGESFRGS